MNHQKVKEALEKTGKGKEVDDNDEKDDFKMGGWKELMGSDLLIKSTKLASSFSDEEPAAVEPEDAVVVDFVGRLAANSNNKDDKNGPIFQKAQDWLVVVGEKDVTPALEMGIRFMKVGEHAAIWSDAKFAHGLSTRRHNGYMLPPNSNVRYDVTVKSTISAEEKKETKFQIKLGLAKKMIGNDAYSNEWSNGQGKGRILRLYKRGADALEWVASQTSDEDSKTLAIDGMLDCLNNIVAVHMRAKEYHQAKQAAVKVLTYDPANSKALIRAAKAAMLDPASSYDEVDAAITAAEEENAQDKDIRKLRLEFRQKKKEYNKRSKEMMKRMVKTKDPPPKGEENIIKEKKCAGGDTNGIDDEVDDETDHILPPEFENREVDWKKMILSSLFQILVPLLMYPIVMYFMKSKMEDSSDHNMKQQSVDFDEESKTSATFFDQFKEEEF